VSGAVYVSTTCGSGWVIPVLVGKADGDINSPQRQLWVNDEMQTKSAKPTTWLLPNKALIVIDLMLSKKIDKLVLVSNAPVMRFLVGYVFQYIRNV
jgi:hypothetical protein